ncbi:hypothetical protein, partial [Sphingobium indicum]|uniref:hypothetical protein n=1 Tax=Sphingobium indicum TaxID=332055 RepID=UPI001E44FD65
STCTKNAEEPSFVVNRLSNLSLHRYFQHYASFDGGPKTSGHRRRLLAKGIAAFAGCNAPVS